MSKVIKCKFFLMKCNPQMIPLILVCNMHMKSLYSVYL